MVLNHTFKWGTNKKLGHFSEVGMACAETRGKEGNLWTGEPQEAWLLIKHHHG